MKAIDARSLSSPVPVLLLQKAMEADETQIIEVLLNDVVTQYNISKFAKINNYTVIEEYYGDDIKIILTPNN